MLLLAAMIGGGGFISVKYLLDWGFTPFHTMFVRFLIAAAALGIIYHKEVRKITKKERKMGALLGVFLAIGFTLVTVGLQFTTPSVNAFLSTTQAVIVPFICWIAFKQRPTKEVFFAAGLTFVGVALLSLNEGFRVDIGAVLSLLSAFGFSLQMAFLSRAVSDCDSVRVTLVQNATTAVIAGVLLLVMHTPMPQMTVPAALSFGYLSLLSTALYFVLQSTGQKHTSANKTALIITTEAVFGAIFSAMIYGERMHFRGYIGCAIIFCAILLAERPINHPKIDG